MANTGEGRTSILSRRSDHMRIVPPKVPKNVTQMVEGIAAAATPRLTYRNGPLLDAVEVFTLFWGDGWTKDPLKGTADYLNKFFQDILTSSLMDQMTEYNVPKMGYTIGHGKYVGTTTITKPSLTQTVTDGTIQHILRQELATNKDIPQPNPNMLYFLYLPP